MHLGSIPGVGQGIGDGRLVERGASTCRRRRRGHINRYLAEHPGRPRQVARKHPADLSLTDSQRIGDGLLRQCGAANAKPEFRALALDGWTRRDLHEMQMYKNIAYDVNDADSARRSPLPSEWA